jgi:hypothetical protein
MEAPLPGTNYYEQRKVAKTAWHFDFHSNPDIAVYLTHGRERWYITRFFDDLTYQPDAITVADIDVYARAFEAPGAMRGCVRSTASSTTTPRSTAPTSRPTAS